VHEPDQPANHEFLCECLQSIDESSAEGKQYLEAIREEVEIVGRALVVRSVEEARRSAEFISAFESILSKRRTAYEELSKGPDQ